MLLPCCWFVLFNILCPLKDGSCTTGIEHVCVLSSSDHSDIVTLGDSKEHAEEEEGAGEELCLGTPYSSQYTFSAAETGMSPATRKNSVTADYNNELFDQNETKLSLPVLCNIKAGLMLNHWSLPQSLVNLGYHLRSQLTRGGSFPGAVIATGETLM